MPQSPNQLPKGFIPDPPETQLPEGFVPDEPTAPDLTSSVSNVEVTPQVKVDPVTSSKREEVDKGFLHSIYDTVADTVNKTGLGEAWNWLNTPMTKLGMGDKPDVMEGRELARQEHPLLMKPLDFAVDTLDSIFTPLNTATAGSLGAGKLLGSPVMSGIGRALSGPVAAEGAINLASPHSTLPERLGGALELAGGAMGMRKPALTANELPTAVIPPEAAVTGVNEMNLNNYLAGMKGVKENQPHRVVLSTISRKIVDDLSEMGYKPGGIVDEGEHAGKPFMVKGDTAFPGATPKQPSLAREIWNLPRGMTTTFDMSAPLRQGMGLIGYKAWWKSWDDMVRAFGSEDAYKLIQKSIDDDPYFQKQVTYDWKKDKKTGEFEWTRKEIPSAAQSSGLAMTDLSNWTRREEVIQSNLVESIPGFGRMARASNRAYTAFLNKLRADTFRDLMEKQKALNGGQAVTDEQSKYIAQFINDNTGRGKLSTIVPNLARNEEGKVRLGIKERGFENQAELASDILFSPRLAASRIRLLNPLTYTDPKLPPMVRKQYLYAALTQAGAWGTMAGLGALTPGTVSLNPTNADFAKIKFGKMRIDPGSGFQQFMVAYARMISQLATSSSTGEVREFGRGYNADTWFDSAVDFGTNKLHPLLKFATDIARASDYRPVQMGDRVLQLYTPLVLQDLADIVKTDGGKNLPPALVAGVLSYFGMGSQVYDKGGKAENLIIPPNFDYTYKGGMFPGMDMAISHLPGVDRSAIEKARNKR